MNKYILIIRSLYHNFLFDAHKIHVRIHDIIFKCTGLLLLALQHGETVPE